MLFSTTQAFSEQLKKSGVFPDVINEFNPSAVLQIDYGNGHQVTMGNELLPSDTQARPTIGLSFTKPTKGKSYTLVVTDPDAPRRGDPTWSEFAHFLVTGIKPEVAEGEPYMVDFAKTVPLLTYMGPGPPPATGLHRYVFILFEESGSPKGLPSDNRANWGFGRPGAGVRDWIKDQSLVPVGINFFVAKNAQQ